MTEKEEHTIGKTTEVVLVISKNDCIMMQRTPPPTEIFFVVRLVFVTGIVQEKLNQQRWEAHHEVNGFECRRGAASTRSAPHSSHSLDERPEKELTLTTLSPAHTQRRKSRKKEGQAQRFRNEQDSKFGNRLPHSSG